jgi:hypothetical protein
MKLKGICCYNQTERNLFPITEPVDYFQRKTNSLLSLRTRFLTLSTFISCAHQCMFLLFSIFIRGDISYKLRKTTQNMSFPMSALQKLHVQHFESFSSIHPHYTAKFDADTRFFQSSYFLGMLKL